MILVVILVLLVFCALGVVYSIGRIAAGDEMKAQGYEPKERKP